MTEPTRDPSNPNDAVQSVLNLVRLYALDGGEPRDILNRVAWMLRENGWGLLGDSSTHLANTITGRAYQVRVRDDGADLMMFPVGEFDLSRFVEPTEPPVAANEPLPEPEPVPVPDTPLAFLKRRRGSAEVPLTLDERLEHIDQKQNHVIELFETLLMILDQFSDRQDRPYTGEMRIMGRKVKMTLTVVDPPSTVTP